MEILETKYIKPLLRGYTGSKYEFLKYIKPFFPNSINVFVDMFTGGGSVSANVHNAKKIIMNELQTPIFKFHELEYNLTTSEIVQHLYSVVDKYSLDWNNREGYEKFRDNYNENHYPLDLIILAKLSFSSQLAFNEKGKFTNTWGVRKEEKYGPVISPDYVEEIRTYKHFQSKQNREFINDSFENFPIDKLAPGDFVYCDPPYFETAAKYNKFWTDRELSKLAEMLQYFIDENIGFGYSDMLIVNDKINILIYELVKRNKNKLFMNKINSDYSNSLDKKKNVSVGKNVEIYLTNIIKR